MSDRPQASFEFFMAMLILGTGYKVGGPALFIVALIVVFGSIIAKLKKEYDPLNRVEAEVSRTKEIMAKYSTELYQQGDTTIRRQIDIAMVERIDALSQIALRVGRNLDSGVLDRRILARKVMPEVMSVLLEVRAKYRGFTGVEAPGMDSLDTLKAFIVEGGPVPGSGSKTETQPAPR